MLDNLNNYRILLGSKSPRRRELLEQLGIPFTVISVGDVEESFPADMDALKVPEYLSKVKSEAYAGSMKPSDMLITADTLVICEGCILGKPVTAEQAHEMLAFLSGKTHHVATGVTIATLDKSISFTSVTDVKFSELTDDEIDYYIDNYSPMDKAGAYGIQEWIGCVAVESIEGSYYNVMGLPVNMLYHALKDFPPAMLV